MINPELAGVAGEGVKKSGREQVPPYAALDAQKKLVLHMTPERILQYIDPNNDYDPFFEALMLRYMEMYDSGDYNGFADYCNAHDNDAFIERAIDQTLTAEDLEKMKVSLFAHNGYTPFFANDQEIEDFIKANTH